MNDTAERTAETIQAARMVRVANGSNVDTLPKAPDMLAQYQKKAPTDLDLARQTIKDLDTDIARLESQLKAKIIARARFSQVEHALDRFSRELDGDAA